MNWIIYSALSTFFFVCLILSTKALTTKSIEAEVLNLYYFTIATVGFFIVALVRNSKLSIENSTLPLFICLAASGVAYKIFIVKAIEIAPNPAYPQAILALNVLIIAFSSVFIFGSELTLIKFFGLLLTAIGVMLVSLPN